MNVCLSLILALWPQGEDGAADRRPDLVLEVYDLEPILPRRETSEWESPLLPFQNYRGTQQSVSMGDSNREVGEDQVRELLLQLLGNQFEYEGRSLETSQRKLYVTAPPAVHENVRKALAFLDQSFHSDVEIAVDILSLVADSPLPAPIGRSSLLPVVEAEKLLAEMKAGVERRSTHRMRLSPGRTASLELSRKLSFLWDHDVQIAAQSNIGDPATGLVELGTRLWVRGTRLPEGLSLALFLRRGEQPFGMRTREIPVKGGITPEQKGWETVDIAQVFQSPDALFRSFVLNTFLPNGRALVLCSSLELSQGKGQEVFVLRPVGDRTQPPSQLVLEQAGRELFIVDTHRFGPPRFVFGISEKADQILPAPYSFEASLESGSPDTVMEMVRRIAQHLDFDFTGLWAWTSYGTGATESVPAMKAALADLTARPRSVEISLNLKRTGGERPHSVKVGLPVQLGETSAGMLGFEGTALTDYDVEVATSSTIPDPRVEIFVEGLFFWVHPLQNSSGDLTLDLKAQAIFRTAPPKELELKTQFMSKLDQMSFDTLVLDERVVFPKGTTSTTLGDSSGQGGPGSISLVVEAR